MPVNHVLPAWDLLAGLHAAVAILAAERVRARSGSGRLVRLALSDVAVATMGNLGYVADAVVNASDRQRDGNYLYGSFGRDFVTADGGRVMVVALTARHWQKLVRLTGSAPSSTLSKKSLGIDLRDEDTRYRFREVLAALLDPWLSSRTMAAVGAELDSHQVLWGPYRTVEQFVHDADSLLHLGGLFFEVDHPGIGTFPTPRSALRFAETTGDAREPAPAPTVGADTDDVLGTFLDLDADQLDGLRQRGVIGSPAR